MFSCFLVDGPRVWAKRRSCSTVFFCELKLFFICQTQTILVRQTQTVLNRQTQTVLIASNSKCSTQLCSEFTQLLQWVLLFEYFLREKSRQWPFHQCILREEFRYFVLCTLFKNITISCIKSLHYSVHSGLCINLQLWNTVLYINPVIMSCLTL